MSERKIYTRPDITCDGEPIPIGAFSILKWSETSFSVFCPKHRAFHRFTTKPEYGPAPQWEPTP